MGAQRDHYENWFANRRGPRKPADEAAALTAADAYDAMQQAGRPSKALMDVIVDAAGNPHGLVWNCAVDLLRKSLREWPEVAETIAVMLKDGRPTARFSAMCCVEESMPPDLADMMIRAGLSDKSGQVRSRAGEAAERLKKVELIPMLGDAVSAEKPGRTRKSLEHSLRMLRDGYILNTMNDGSYSLWITTPHGSTGISVSEAELKAKGIDRLVAELRASP